MLLGKEDGTEGVDNDFAEKSMENIGAWIDAGRLYERIALEAERRCISTAPSAAAIQIGEFYKKLQAVLQTQWRPQFFCRIGNAPQAPHHSPRLSLADVVKK